MGDPNTENETPKENREAPPDQGHNIPTVHPPNIVNTVENGLPILIAVIVGFLGALFVSTALSSSKLLSQEFSINPLAWVNLVEADYSLKRKTLILVLCGISLLLFIISIRYCLLSKMLNLDEAPSDIQIQAGQRKQFYEETRYLAATIARWCYNIAMALALIPLLLLPSSFFVRVILSITYAVIIIYFLKYDDGLLKKIANAKIAREK